MRQIQPELTSELSEHFKDAKKIGLYEPFAVNTYRELVEHVAKLSFKNKDYLLFFRGQNIDYKNKAGSSTFYPSLYRGDYLLSREIKKRYDTLEASSRTLIKLFEKENIEGWKELKRRKAIQWSVLQHYEVCETPYLDFTQSLRVACSFATMDNDDPYAYVFVFGLPYFTNRISINSEHEIINIRLLSICPPTALRPYFQEGYLIGTEDITTEYEDKTELDFNNRLVAKFQIPNKDTFWNGFDKISKESLYPKDDPIFELCQRIHEIEDNKLSNVGLDDFLILWSELESSLFTLAGKESHRYLGVWKIITLLNSKGIINDELASHLNQLRRFRNNLAHNPKEFRDREIQDLFHLLNNTIEKVKKIKPY